MNLLIQSPHSIRAYWIHSITVSHFVPSLLNPTHHINVNCLQHANNWQVHVFPDAAIKDLTLIVHKLVRLANHPKCTPTPLSSRLLHQLVKALFGQLQLSFYMDKIRLQVILK